jgi:quercetin dioxygenase-like cupin family protein
MHYEDRVFILYLVCIAPSCSIAQQVQVTPLMSKDINEFPGKEGTMISVEYAPGASEPVHRHSAYVFVYVVEGAVVMQIRGGKDMTLKAGQTFYEAPTDVHVIARNASTTKPAKFIAFLVKDKDAPTHIPAK